MSNSKGTSTTRNLAYSGKHAFLPPKSPFPSISPNHFDYAFTPTGSTAVQRPREGYNHHQRTSSESFLIEDQPSWVDDLLNEPETPVRRGGHRRSSSDSFAYVDVANISNLVHAAHDDHNYGNAFSASSWGSRVDHLKDGRNSYLYAEINHVKQKNKLWDSSQNGTTHPSGVSSAGDAIATLHSGPPSASQEVDRDSSTANEKQEQVEIVADDSKASSEKKSASRAKPSSETDNKRAKQQFAQRSRVRKLQYIAELERNVQALQVEGSEVSAEIEFLNQQHLILSMENNALKQRLESLAQEQFIKYFEHEVLEREIGRLRALYQQQQNQHQHQQQPSSSHKRTNSKDLDVQFANLTLNHKDATSSRDAVTGPLRT